MRPVASLNFTTYFKRKKMNPYIYLRGLRHADHTVFNVADGQKRYWDEQFQRFVAYCSGQHVKRSVLEEVSRNLGEEPAPVTFYFEAPSLKEKEVTTPGDPRYADQLLGGWMIANAGGNNRTIKRRSPLSISALRALHPLLSNVNDENLSFDRSDRPELHQVVVTDNKGNQLTDEEIAALLKGSDRSLRRKWIQGNRRATGLFVYDVAIDLRTLFSVSINELEPELSEDVIAALKENGWKESTNIFGQCLVAPRERREQLIPGLAKSLLSWRITTNQARTFSPMEMLAVAISQDANKITGAIRAKLNLEGEKPRATPIVDASVPDVDTFVTLAGGGYFATESESHDALDRAEKKLIELMSVFPYEEQAVPDRPEHRPASNSLF